MTPIGVIGLAVTVICVGAFAMSGPTGVLVAWLVKPVVDAAWEPFLGELISPVRIFGVVIPALMLLRLLTSGWRLSSAPLFGIWVVYLAYFTIPAAVRAADQGLLSFLDSFFRLMNGFAGFFLLQAYFSRPEAFRRLLLVLIASTVFPVSVGIYQAVTGVVWRADETVGLLRYSGLYHDIGTVRYNMFLLATSALLYWSYFRPRNAVAVKAGLLLTLLAAGAVVLFNTYSKASYVIVVAWALIWSVGRRQLKPLLAIVALVVITNVFFYDRIWAQAEQLYSRELAFLAAEESATEGEREQTLAGRWVIWEVLLEEYAQRPFISQVFGGGGIRRAHNDFIGTLLEGGVIGLVVYVALLLAVALRLFGLYRRDRSPLTMVAIMVFAMWLIDAIGLSPRQYSGYQWYVWGFIGLALRGLEQRRRQTEPNAAPAAATVGRPVSAA